MTIKTELPEGYSFPLPKPSPPGGKKMNAQEAEQEMLKITTEREKKLREAYFDLAVLYSQTGRQDKALIYVQALIAMTKDSGEKAHYYLAMGQLMEQLRDFVAAVDYYTQSLELEPVNPHTWYFIHNNLGFSLNMQERYEEGERYCRAAIQINSRLFNAHKNLGISLKARKSRAKPLPATSRQSERMQPTHMPSTIWRIC